MVNPRRRSLLRAILLCCVLVLPGIPWITAEPPAIAPQAAYATTAGNIAYVYDELNRLIAVVDPASDAAIYSYDAVGNITAIQRYSATQLSIIAFTPTHGAVGTSVTIWGTGFSTTPADNSVSFNGTAATVTAATETQLIASVPAGATSGTITVTTPSDSTTSSQGFTVGSAAAPTISSLSATVVPPGSAFTISGSNFETDPLFNNVAFNGSRAQVTSAAAGSLGVNVPPMGSGRVTVSTPSGTVSSTSDVYVPPSGIAVGDVLVTDRMAVGGSKTVTLGTASKVGLVLFDGSQGQRVSLQLSSISFSIATVAIYGLAGEKLSSLTVSTNGGLIEPLTLPASGSFLILVDPHTTSTGSLTLNLYDVPPDATASITPGGASATVSTTVPGQNAQVTFSGTQNQRISLNLTGITMGLRYVSILNPDGSALVSPVIGGGNSQFFDVQVLPLTGTYTILIDPYKANTGSATLTLYDVPVDVNDTISIDGSSVTVTTTSPGQNALLTFAGTQNQRISLNLTNITMGWRYVSILKPDGSALISPALNGSTSQFFDVQVLPSTGTYTILIDPYQANTGSATLTLYDVPADVSDTITPGGSAVTITTTTPGQNAQLTFSGTQNQRISLNLTNVTMGWRYVSILKPDGSALVSPTLGPTTSQFIDVQVLPVSGTYTILIDPYQTNTGSATLTLYDVPADLNDTISVGGSSVTITTTTPGQNALLTFAGTQNQSISLALSNITMGWRYVSIENPDSSTLVSPTLGAGSSQTVGPATLPATGTYTILIDPYQANTGSATLTLSESSGSMSAPKLAAVGDDPQLGAATEAIEHDSAPPDPDGQDTPPEEDLPEDVAGGPEDWIPEGDNFQGEWTSGQADSPWQFIPPLEAAPGATALSGQVLVLNGKPLEDVTLVIDGHVTTTDRTGRFLVEGLAPGFHTLHVDGNTAGTPGKQYGAYRIGVDLVAGQTTVLPYTIWLTKLDNAGRTKIKTTPTSEELVVTNPKIPGLELHIPAGSTVTDADGEIVTEISITPIPIDRTPFPLPADFPVYFTIQPGGALVSPEGAWLVYPNYTGEAPGTRVDFWNYDPEEGWHSYGQGTVTEDGNQIVPDPDVRVYTLMGAGAFIPGGGPPSSGPPPGENTMDGDPVDLSTGLFVMEKTDLVLPDVITITLTRTYRQNDDRTRAFGIGQSHPYELHLYNGGSTSYTYWDLILPDGGSVHFERISAGTDKVGGVFEHSETPSAFYKARIIWNGAGWFLTQTDGTVYVFGDSRLLLAIRDHAGNQVTVVRANGQSGTITHIRSPHGRWVRFDYDSLSQVAQATDNLGRVLSYTYSLHKLLTVTDLNDGVTEYTWSSSPIRLLTIEDARGIVFLTNEYDANGRISKQTQADNTTYQFAYTLDGNGEVTQTEVTDPRGKVRRVTFNADGHFLTDTAAYGTADAQTLTVERQSGTNLITAAIDALSRRTEYTYDGKGNVLSVTRLAGTGQAITTSFTYEPIFNQVTSVTDPLSHTTSFDYDTAGNLTEVTDALNHTTTIAYNAAGQPTAVTDALNHTTTYSFVLGDLVQVTDPLNRVTKNFFDAGGRELRSTDALGTTTLSSYDALNRLTRVTDALGGETDFSYDPNSNLLSLTDPLNHTTSWAYDSMDRVSSRTDPLNRSETYGYDANGNLTSFTDRKDQVTVYQYDNLNRHTFTGFDEQSGAYDSTVTFTYDAGNRLTQVDDSLDGVITLGYDDLDRLTSESTPRGTVGYGYDAADRQTSMTVGGQSAVSYSYDAADRLTTISQGTSSTTIGYDVADRTTSVTLPNGVVTSYGYDAASQLTSFAYTLGAATLGDLSYGYDLAARRTSMGGSFARTGLPAALSSAIYDAANQIVTWGGASYSYDANGNLTSDGTNTYSWDARNQLASISGATAASFNYDAFGRRTQATVAGVTTGYHYDGENIVQELNGSGTPTANWLSGLGLDSFISRSDANGQRTQLFDALGSTLALVDDSGTLQTEYTYEPFGGTTTSGAADPNPVQYTGREHDGTGLYYYRARYYDPALGRFISEDPIGFAGGQLNLHAYVANNPVQYTDPSGKDCPAPDASSGSASCPGAAGPGGNLSGGRPLSLPPRAIVRDRGVTIEHYYRGGDHGPPHLHVRGGGPNTRIGQNGKPLAGDPELTPLQRDVINAHLKDIRAAVGQIGRWHRSNLGISVGGISLGLRK